MNFGFRDRRLKSSASMVAIRSLVESRYVGLEMEEAFMELEKDCCDSTMFNRAAVAS